MTGLTDKATGKEILTARRLASGKLELVLYRHFSEALADFAGEAALREYAEQADRERLLLELLMEGSYEAAFFKAKADETYLDFAKRVFIEATLEHEGLGLDLALIECEMAARWQVEEDEKARVKAITLRIFHSPATAAAIEAYEKRWAHISDEEAARRIMEFEAQLKPQAKNEQRAWGLWKA